MLPSVRSQQVSLASSSLVSISFRYAVVIVISFTFFRLGHRYLFIFSRTISVQNFLKSCARPTSIE